jgi:hypothetical protein
MQVVRGQPLIGAGLTTNVLAATLAAFIGPPSLITLYATGDSVAATPLTHTLQVNQGGSSQTPIAPGSGVNQAAAAGVGPKLDEDLVLMQYSVPAMSALVLNVTNPAAGGIVYRFLLFLV